MGILRFLLAVSVVIAHTNKIFGFGLVGGRLAVQSFYIISGFYMTLILKEKYIGKNKSYRLFITNRLLRLYPIYWTVLILTIFVSLGVYMTSSGHSLERLQPYYDHIDTMGFGTLFFLVFSNIALIFQDLVMFLGLDPASGGLFFTQNFRHTNPQLHNFLLVPQAWTIGVEIAFYLIAPFLVRRRIRFVVALLLLSLLLRVILYYSGLKHDPWSYRFFPTEIFFFLLGAIAYHMYKKLDRMNIKKLHLKRVFGFILLFTLFYSWLPSTYKMYVYLLFFFMSIPFVFMLSKNWKKDRYIGELSYPIYISHILVAMIVGYIEKPAIENPGLVTVILTILVSIILNELISKKVESIRQRRLKPEAETDKRSGKHQS